MIFSIDPGINNCGISVNDIDSKFTVVETHLVKNARKFTEPEKAVELVYGNRTVKVQAIVNKLQDLLNKYPDTKMLTIEAPFYNALTPMAYGSLLEVIFAIKYSFIIPNNLNFKLIEPLLVKKMFSNNHMASKEVMRQFLIAKKADGSIIMPMEIESLSEHEIDSIAIGFVYNTTTKEPTPV